MSFQAHKKISVPCEKHLQKERIKKRKSKMFNHSKENDESFEDEPIKGKFESLVKSDLFSQYNCQSQVSLGCSQLADGAFSFCEDDSKCKFNGNLDDCGILNEIMNQLDEGELKCKSQPVTCNMISFLKSKAKKMDFSQRFRGEENYDLGWEGFQPKRNKI